MISKMRIWEILENKKQGDKYGRIDDALILLLIFLNVVAIILGSVKWIELEYKAVLDGFEVFSVIVFTVEYIFRLWSCVSDAKYSKPILGRLHYAMTPLLLIDLFAIIPFYLPFLLVDLRLIRIFRLLRIFRVAKAVRYFDSLKLLGRVFKTKMEELVITSMVLLMLLIVASFMIYIFENSAQPDKFTDIPSAMWWAVATLTTVGYGDVYPITSAGKIVAAIVSILGIGMFALPTGILGAGFVEEVQKAKKIKNKMCCPHCGKEL